MKLKTKIQLFTTVFMFLLILLVNAAVYFLFYKTSAESELEQLQEQTTVLVETIQSNPNIVERELLNAFLPTDGMIRITNESGKPQIKTITKKSEYITLPKQYSTKETHQVIKRPDGANVAVIEKPIIWNDGEIVTLQVSKHLVALQSTMQTLFYVLLIATALILIPTFIAGNILSRFLIKPIQTFIQTMKRNTEAENWEKIDIVNESKDELYQMETTFNEMIDHLKNNFQKQEQFVSDASHELKTPISIIKGYAQFMKRHGAKRPDMLPETIDAINSETERMQLLVEQMLELAKNRNQVEFKKTDVDIIHLCETIIKSFTGLSNRKIKLFSAHQSIYIYANKDRIEQVIYILIDNALKYSEADIELTFNIRNGLVTVEVIDFGTGIPKENLAHVFDRFYRVDKARSRDTGGTGLGLAIAKTIINEHEGTISVKSDLDKGTRFIFSLPLAH